ncbi:MAG: hypothetical protein Q9164_004240 [Protoblastenia rupestris]
MLRASFRRSSRSRILRAGLIVLFVALLIDCLTIANARQRSTPVIKATPDVRGQRIFVASIHWNNERILRSSWNNAVVNLVKYFGRENVYISIYESGSWDDTKGALRLLDSQLAELDTPRTIVLEETTHANELEKPPTVGWIDTARGKKELRRIPYLAKLRNLSLKPLAELEANGTKFDKVLFLNDVAFTVEDVATLLATRDGDYAAACSLDFAKPPDYYDTFALRDSNGHEAVTPIFPYFRSKTSRDALLAGHPILVQSCWNGIVAFDARPFYEPNALKFRGIPDSLAAHHLEGSECCLIHTDNPLTSTHGVWLNPHVRVGYSVEAYDAVHGSHPWPSTLSVIRGIWSNRFWRWTTSTALKDAKVYHRLKQWKAVDAGRSESGTQCLINEMQVLVANGWAHV